VNKNSDNLLGSEVIVVNREPYCVWEVGLKQRNIEFINSIDTEYFDYVLRTHDERLDSKDDKRAAIALRIAYHHGLETLFLLIGALVQAPECTFAWISKCSVGELRDLVGRINQADESIFTALKMPNVTWESIAEIVFRYYLPGSEQNKKTVELFAKLWRSLSSEYLDENNISEYNSLKHGFRVRSGGFGLSAGVEHKDGVSAPENEMQTLCNGKHGSSFTLLEKIGNGRNLRVKRVSLNWRIERVTLLLQLISMSIQNIVSILKIASGAKKDAAKFVRPVEDEDFKKPWSYTDGVLRFCESSNFDEASIPPATKKELDEIIRNTLKERRKRNKSG
jgi:hypothetical protein